MTQWPQELLNPDVFVIQGIHCFAVISWTIKNRDEEYNADDDYDDDYYYLRLDVKQAP